MPYDKAIRNKVSPGWTIYLFTQPKGGPQGITVTVGTGGTNKSEPAAGIVLFKQLLTFNTSAVVLYLSAMLYSVSFALTMI